VIYYEKRGRRYHPIATDDWRTMEGLHEGAHLVIIGNGCTMTRINVVPDHAAALAALRTARDAITEEMHKAAEYLPKRIPLTELHRRAFAAYQAAIPPHEREALWAGSIQDGLDAAERALMDEIEKSRKPETAKGNA
jgi:hypothetical protein